MMPPSNTPPDGDFVRYIERLTAVKPPPYARSGLLAFKQAVPAAIPAAISTPAAAGWGEIKTRLKPFTQHAFLSHLKWLAGLWLAVTVAAWFVPGAGFLLAPLFVLYAAWVIFQLRHKAPGAFAQALSRLAARTSQPTAKDPKNK